MTQQLAVKRVIVELSPTQQFIRAVDRARQIREAGEARLDADFANRVLQAQSQFLGKPEDPNEPEQQASEPTDASEQPSA